MPNQIRHGSSLVDTVKSGSNQVDRVYSGSDLVWELDSTTVTLSGASISHTTGFSTAKAGVRFNSDGTVDRRIGDSYTQIDSLTDWIIENTDADGTYDIRVSSVVWTNGSAFTLAGAGNGVWVGLGADREWMVEDAISSPLGNKLVTFTVSIRKDGGAILDQASYTLEADYES